MKVGISFTLDNPSRFKQDTARLYGFTLEMCEEVERLGGDFVSFSEHHLWENGHLTQPLTYAAAAAARTKKIGLFTRILIAPLRSAAQIAEEAAVVDLISAGRLELGLGVGYRASEYELFGADFTRRYSATDQRVRDLRNIWAEGKVTPMPVHGKIPIWMGYQGPQGARRAGLLGEGLLTIDPASWEWYQAGLAEGGHDPSVGRRAGSITGWISDDPEADWPTVSEHLAFKWNNYRQFAVEGMDRPPPKPIDPEVVRSRELGGVLRAFLHDTPEEAARRIKQYIAGAPVEAIDIDAPLIGMSEDLIAKLVQTVCTRLAPLLRDS